MNRSKTLLVLLVLLFAACRVELPEPPDLTNLQPLPQSEADVVLEEIRTDAERIRSMRARLDAKLKTKFSDEALTQVVVFEKPDRLRMEFFATGLNKLTALLITQKGAIHAIDPINMRVYRGPERIDTISRLLPIPFSSKELMLWLSGDMPLPESDEVVAEAADEIVFQKGNTVTIRAPLKDGRVFLAELLRIAKTNRLQLAHFEVQGADGVRKLISRYKYPERILEDSLGLPEQIEFWLPKRSLTGELQYADWELNPDFGKNVSKLFTGRTPAGAKVYDLGDPNVVEEIEPFF